MTDDNTGQFDRLRETLDIADMQEMDDELRQLEYQSGIENEPLIKSHGGKRRGWFVVIDGDSHPADAEFIQGTS